MDEKGGGEEKKNPSTNMQVDYNSKPPQKMDEKEVASLSYCLGKWMKDKRGAMKKEELAMVVVVSTTKQMGEKGKRAEFCEEEEKEEEQEKKKKKKNHVAKEAAKCQKQQEDALLAGQKQVGRMKNKKHLCC
jgi:hypothetical protein